MNANMLEDVLYWLQQFYDQHGNMPCYVLAGDAIEPLTAYDLDQFDPDEGKVFIFVGDEKCLPETDNSVPISPITLGN